MLYPKKINIKNKYCPKCFKKLCNNDIKFVKANLKVRDNWRPTNYFHPYIECKDCNVTESLPEASDILHDACCFSQGILTPNEIKNLRRKLKLTQKALAKLLGLGTITISRWETRKIFQSKVNDNFLRLLSRDPIRVMQNLNQINC